MALIRWDPIRDVLNIQKVISKALEQGASRKDGEGYEPPVDIYEKDGRLYLDVELPGVKSEDVNMEIKDDTLYLSGEIKPIDLPAEKYVRRERYYGKFERTFTVGEKLNKDTIKAAFKNGVLSVTFDLVEEKKPEAKKIHIQAE